MGIYCSRLLPHWSHIFSYFSAHSHTWTRLWLGAKMCLKKRTCLKPCFETSLNIKYSGRLPSNISIPGSVQNRNDALMRSPALLNIVLEWFIADWCFICRFRTIKVLSNYPEIFLHDVNVLFCRSEKCSFFNHLHIFLQLSRVVSSRRKHTHELDLEKI